MFRIKICGVRLEQDIHVAEKSGADAIGLNFFPPSVRYLEPHAESTQKLATRARQLGLFTVGVFVNETTESLLAMADAVRLDAIQLHGDEPVRVAKELRERGRRVIRAIKLPRGPLAPSAMEQIAAPWREVDCHLLLDVDAGASHGGSGKTLDWPSVREWAKTRGEESWTLAGGLSPENIGEAIQSSGAVSVDTASGVECPKGVKNAGRIERFCESYRASIGRRDQT